MMKKFIGLKCWMMVEDAGCNLKWEWAVGGKVCEWDGGNNDKR